MDRDALQAEWSKRGIRSTDLGVDEDGTILPPTEPLVDAAAALSAVVDDLPDALENRGPLVAIGDEIGRGGMGVVYAGQQRSLGREVAVKTARGGHDETVTLALLREAWISGHLEHPNVIPVYALYRKDRTPLLLMKRVEGAVWSDALRAGGTLEAHLRTLVQLCHAVHYAHTRGIVHLDLKPDNVMIGGYGEIYLLDWGIAASVVETHPPFIARARDLACVLGTPAYMAPELAIGDGAAIGPHTDVYLLGAVLHQVLVGTPPHARKTLIGSVTAAFECREPSWPSDVPEELAKIAAVALAKQPARRFASAALMREAIEDYLVHADSLTLAGAARERAALAVAALEHRADDGDEHGEHGERDEAERSGRGERSERSEPERLASEAEFGFRQALHVWPDNVRAREGLQELLERLIARDLEAGRWRVAARRSAELPEPQPELDARIAALEQAEARQAQELRQRRDDADLGRAARQRSLMAYIGALLWTIALVGLATLSRLGVLRASHEHMLAVTSAAVLIFGVIVVSGRRALFANAINRSVVALLSLGWALAALYWVGAWVTATPFRSALVGIGPLIAFVVAAAAVTVDRRLRPHAAVAIAAAVLHPFFADYALEVLGATGGIVLAMLGWTWKTPPAADLSSSQPSTRSTSKRT